MSIVVPAILEQTKEGFLEKEAILKQISGLERVQVDFADGVLVGNTTVNVADVDTLNPMYHWEAHLMINAPGDFLDYQICGFSTVLVHFEAYPEVSLLTGALEKIKQSGMKAGLVINPKTQVAVCKQFEHTVEHFLVMAVEPGFQGAPFIESSYEKIAELRRLIPHATIEVDGGVKSDNIKLLRDAGADLLAAGSAVFKAQNPAEAFQKLTDLIK